jgi:hypothetical protein
MPVYPPGVAKREYWRKNSRPFKRSSLDGQLYCGQPKGSTARAIRGYSDGGLGATERA